MVYINEEKLNNIKLNDNNFCVVIDFDRTITTYGGDSWNILTNPNFINPNLKKEFSKLEEKYFPIESDCSLDAKTKFSYMEEWCLLAMNLFFKYGLSEDILLNCVKHSNIKLRTGLKDFFKELVINHHIPVVILSAGIKNVIVELLKINNCYYDDIHIISNDIKFDDGAMLEFTDTILHSSNKSIEALPYSLKNEILSKDYILLFGDLIEDLNMVPKEDLTKTLSFGFLDKNIEDNLEFYKSAFDVVLTNNSSFDDVRNILNRIKND